MLEIKNLFCGYRGIDVIRDLSLRAEPGEFLCIVGPNGCGKTTLLKSMVRLIPYRGSITLEGRDISSYARKDLARRIALLGQSSELYFPYTVYDTAALGRYAHSGGFLRGLSREDERIIADILQRLELYEEKDRMINELSGGQLQRVFLAQTLVQNPDLILLDEPTNHLDLKHQIELLRYLTRWAEENNKTVIGVLHDLNLARFFARTVAVLGKGRLIARGRPGTVLDGETLGSLYGVDIRQFMLDSLENWRDTPAGLREGGQAPGIRK
ncbi:MAG: ABC transporter ATP-binding protein [Treponema sp.]|jgi:iron complex transport system ATP-binding protein|nr:ABC transporter ATP-binding protein [Treponema sp.]